MPSNDRRVKTIMLVDNSETDAIVSKEVLINAGYQVIHIPHANNIINDASAYDPDCIMMDVILPGKNGFEATRNLTRTYGTGHIPILLCSTKFLEVDITWGLRNGAKGYIRKPLQKDMLIREIKRTLSLGMKKPVKHLDDELLAC